MNFHLKFLLIKTADDEFTEFYFMCLVLYFQRSVCTKEWPTNKEIPGTRDVSRNVDVTMPARTSIPALTGKSLYRDGLHEKGFR